MFLITIKLWKKVNYLKMNFNNTMYFLLFVYADRYDINATKELNGV